RCGHCSAEFDHPGGFHRAPVAGGYGAGSSRHRCRRSPLPSHAANSRRRGSRRRRNPFRPDLPGSGHRADGGRGGVARTLAHDRAYRLLCGEPKEKTGMSIERYLRLISGFFVILSVALGYAASPAWFLFTAFVGLNLLQSGLTNWCPMMVLLRKLGV